MSEEQNEMFFSCEIADLCIKLQDVKNRSVFPIQDCFFFFFPILFFFFNCGYLQGAVPFDLLSEAPVRSWKHLERCLVWLCSKPCKWITSLR